MTPTQHDSPAVARSAVAKAPQDHPFVPLKVHTAYSLSEGAVKLPDLMDFCTRHAIPAVAVTDQANVFGAMEFSLAAAKAGVQPIVGVCLYLESPDGVAEQGASNTASAAGKMYHEITLLARSDQGYKNLVKLISRCYMRDAVLVPRVALAHPHSGQHKREHISIFPTTHAELREVRDGLICVCGGEKSGPYALLLADRDADAKGYLLALKDIFQEQTYVGIERLGERIDDHTFVDLSSGEAYTEPKLLAQAAELNLPIVAMNSAYFLEAEDFPAHDALLCVADGKRIMETDRRYSREGYRLRTPQEIRQLFADLPEAIENTSRIARSCAFVLAPVKPALPPYDTPLGEDGELRKQAQAGLERRLARYGDMHHRAPEAREAFEKTYYDRLDYEIGVINRMGYSGYFLIVADFIQYAKKVGIPVGPGRGSGAGSLVAWALTITDVDPIEFKLIFERFLNPERVSMPDFDIDFCQERRDQVIAYVCRKYGFDRVAQIATFGKFQARMVIRDLCRVYGIPFLVSGDIAKLIPNDPTNPLTLQQAIDQDPSIVAEINNRVPEHAEDLLHNALRLEGLYRHASTHAAGIVIGGEPLENIVALYRDPDARHYDPTSKESGVEFRLKDLPATQFNMKYVEMTGLVKFDFLGLKTLSVMQDCIQSVLQTRGVSVDLSTIPLDDTATFDLLCRVETVGVFQLESAGMRDVIRNLQPRHFEEVIALVALYRPGPMDDIPRYIACRHGEEQITYAHPLMEGILKDTYGVMVYQEQVMQIAQKLAGYGLGAADMLRRAMGKKIQSEMDAQREIFIEGCRKHNDIQVPLASKIFDQMAKFASYGFNKCHSAPYGLIAYQTAYLKANYPEEFMAAMMNFDMNNTDKLAVITEELHRMGIEILPPDINRSASRFTVDTHPDTGARAIRYALAAIKNVGEVNTDAIVRERQARGPFKNLQNFLERMDSENVTKRVLENFSCCGVFDSFVKNRASLYASVPTLIKHVGELRKSDRVGQSSLFGQGESSLLPSVALTEVPEWTAFERAQQEFNALGLYLNEHPVNAYKDLIQDLNVSYYGDLCKSMAPGSEKSAALAAVIVSKKERLSKSGTKFAFVQFSDPSGMFEGVLFNESYQSVKHLIEVGQTVLIQAQLRLTDQDMKVTISSLDSLEDSTANCTREVFLTVTDAQAIELLHDWLLNTQRGRTRLKVLLKDGRYETLIQLPRHYRLGRDALEQLAKLTGVTID